MSPICSICGKPSATIQADLFGGPQLCLTCLTTARIQMLLRCLPSEDDNEWENLTEWEQRLLPSVRDQFARTQVLTDKQFQRLEMIWKKLN